MHTKHLLFASLLTTAFCAAAKPCLAAEAGELPRTGFAVEGRMPLETAFFALVSYGGGVLVGHRSPRKLLGVGAEFVEQFTPSSGEWGARYVPSKYHRITLAPTIQYAFARSASRAFEFCIGAELPLGVMIQQRKGTNIDGPVDETNFFPQLGLRFLFGPRYWMSPRVAVSLPFALGVMLMQWTPIPTFGVAPALMAVF